MRGNLSKLARMILGALIVIEVSNVNLCNVCTHEWVGFPSDMSMTSLLIFVLDAFIEREIHFTAQGLKKHCATEITKFFAFLILMLYR